MGQEAEPGGGLREAAALLAAPRGGGPTLGAQHLGGAGKVLVPS